MTSFFDANNFSKIENLLKNKGKTSEDLTKMTIAQVFNALK